MMENLKTSANFIFEKLGDEPERYGVHFFGLDDERKIAVATVTRVNADSWSIVHEENDEIGAPPDFKLQAEITGAASAEAMHEKFRKQFRVLLVPDVNKQMIQFLTRSLDAQRQYCRTVGANVAFFVAACNSLGDFMAEMHPEEDDARTLERVKDVIAARAEAAREENKFKAMIRHVVAQVESTIAEDDDDETGDERPPTFQ